MTDLPQWAMEKAGAAVNYTSAVNLTINEFDEVVAAIARALVEAEARGIERAAAVAYQNPHYVMSISYNDGVLLPGSPYDRGRYDAMNDIRNLKETE